MTWIEEWSNTEHALEMYSKPKTPSILTSGEMSSGVYRDSDGKQKSWVKIDRASKSIFQYEVRTYITADDPTYHSFKDLPCKLLDLKTNQAYEVAIKQIHRKTGMGSPFSTDYSYTTAKDTTAPSVPTGLVIVGEFHRISIAWENPTASDLRSVEVYRKVAAEDYSYAWEGLTESFIDVERNHGTVVAFKIRSEDRSGNKSDFTEEVSGTVNIPSSVTTNASWAPGTIVNGGSASIEVAMAGVQASYLAIATFSESLQGCTLSAVAGEDKVIVTITNNTGSDKIFTVGTVTVWAYPS